MFKTKPKIERSKRSCANFMPGTPQSSNVLDSRAYFSKKSKKRYILKQIIKSYSDQLDNECKLFISLPNT